MRTPLSKIDDYPAYLAMMWRKHLAPRSADAPTVISTFAGGGGSSLGYSMAGFQELLAVEWDDNAVKTFKLNFPDVPVYHGDIAKLIVNECLELSGISVGELDILDGSPPCQGFSTSGKREFDDTRNELACEFIRLLRGLRPKVFVMENVSGMVKGKMKILFAEILKELKASGYNVSARLLNAKWFGVPQSRERMIFIGVRDDLGITPSHPVAGSRPIAPRGAIGGMTPDVFDEFDDGLKLAANEIIAGHYGDSHVEKAFKKYKGTSGGAMSFKLLSWDRVSCTITKIWPGWSGVGHPDRRRYLAINELKRIGSFPDEYRMPRMHKMALGIIGNSVPPLFMEAIARHIRVNILDKI